MEGEFRLYKQSFGFSCGPASLMMVMRSLDPSLHMDLPTEISIWRVANLVESRSTSAHGLALASAELGFRSKVIARDDGIGFHHTLKRHFPQIDMALLGRVQGSIVARARALGVEERFMQFGMEEVEEVVRSGSTPVVLISSSLMGEEEGIPHWVVALSVGDKVAIANPETGAIESYKPRDLERHLGFDGYTAMVIVTADPEKDSIEERQGRRTRRV